MDKAGKRLVDSVDKTGESSEKEGNPYFPEEKISTGRFPADGMSGSGYLWIRFSGEGFRQYLQHFRRP